MLKTIQRPTTLSTNQLSNRSLIEMQDGTTLFFQDWGTGKPVVFVHGWVLGAAMWEYQMTALSSQGLRCIAYDKRGCGRSSQPGDSYDFDTLADDLATLIEQLDLQDVTLVAHSMGGGEIARYLSRYGTSRIERTVLIATITPFLYRTTDNPDRFDPRSCEQAIASLQQDRPHYFTAMAPGVLGDGLSNGSVSLEIAQWLVNVALQASPRAAIQMMQAQAETDFRDDIAAFTVPTLIIHGDRDMGTPIALTGQKTADAISGSQLKVYEGAAHGLFVTHKEQLNQDLLTFIRGK
ncbi:alpha/beta fold hydrolase [Pantanalinema sp. GBBB05]|uniref:alpha/beta fold hydrolase n=1 Tax=Pantanalinema sp. GBBB05 TaxID=2604139 RepID=UPI001DF1D9F6|nr:alpha/beta hydrolase [Pantanalinema sp. GBBB05]